MGGGIYPFQLRFGCQQHINEDVDVPGKILLPQLA